MPTQSSTPARAKLVFHPSVIRGAWERLETWVPPPDTREYFRDRVSQSITRTIGTTPRRVRHRYFWGDAVGYLRTSRVIYTPPEGRYVHKNKRQYRQWVLDLNDRHGTPRHWVRQHPTFWFFALPLANPWRRGGVLVIPDCVIPQHRVLTRLNQKPNWLWQYWERWDCLLTYPDLPDDLIRA